MKKLPDFITNQSSIEKHHSLECPYHYFEIAKENDSELFDFLRSRIKNSYVNPNYLANVLKKEGFTGIANLLEDKFPDKYAPFHVRTGDFGEVITEILLEDIFYYIVPVKKLRYKINKDKPSFGIDVIAFNFSEDESKDEIIFAETKASTAKDYGITKVIGEIDELAAYSSVGKQKIRSTIRFISERLFSEGNSELESRINKFLEKIDKLPFEFYVPCFVRDISTWNHDALDNKSFSFAPLERTSICVCAINSLDNVMDEAYKIVEDIVETDTMETHQ